MGSSLESLRKRRSEGFSTGQPLPFCPAMRTRRHFRSDHLLIGRDRPECRRRNALYGKSARGDVQTELPFFLRSLIKFDLRPICRHPSQAGFVRIGCRTAKDYSNQCFYRELILSPSCPKCPPLPLVAPRPILCERDSVYKLSFVEILLVES